ncbi:hypothetical protein AB1Y20_013939 [Prymnesium parvum]|uniref:Secreted protein n=1 Tax=Prymnesium parvum TaxID=97485 RepID=A0AB34IIA6_PRYPA
MLPRFLCPMCAVLVQSMPVHLRAVELTSSARLGVVELFVVAAAMVHFEVVAAEAAARSPVDAHLLLQRLV